MIIAFIGYKNSFHYDKIGGTDAIVRRISNYLSDKNKIYILNYGHKKEKTTQISKNIIQVDFLTLNDMFEFILKNNILNSISIYLKPLDRIKAYLFQKKHSNIVFHTLITVYNENIFKKWVLFLESSLTYQGNIYCVSNRIFKSMKNISSKSILLLPPVDDNFFCTNEIKASEKIKISYMGRLDYGKGADLAYEYFINSDLDPNKYDFYMYAYPWENDAFSVDLHNKLLQQTKVKYIETKLYSDPIEIDKFLAKVIDDTNLFFLPYRFMRSTIDAPLVPMEIMSRGKPFISTNIGGIKEITYHPDALLEIKNLSSHQLVSKRIELILSKNFSIQKFVTDLGYSTSATSNKILSSFKNKGL